MDLSLWSISKNYNANKKIRIETPLLRSDLCDFSDAYIVVKGIIAVTNPNNAERNKAVAFKKQWTTYELHLKNQWCSNWQCRHSRCCNANVQFPWIQQKVQKNNREFM